MKIGKNSIQGIYKYSQTCTPEINDFVLQDNKLWICKKTGTTDSPSSNSEDWKEYMSSDVATEEEVLEGILGTGSNNNSTQWLDKSVKVEHLQEILDSVFYGLTNKGVIKSYQASLSEIENDTEHPYGIYAVSRLDDDSSGLTPNPDFSGLISVTDENKNIPVFVKKYTYQTTSTEKSGGITTYLLVELCDYQDGTLWFKLKTPGSTENIINWRLVSPGTELRNTIETLVNQYRARINELDSIENSIRSSFRFTKLTFPEIEGEDSKYIYINPNNSESLGSSTTYPSLKNGTTLDYTIVVLIKEESTGIYYSDSITIPGTSSISVYLNIQNLPNPPYIQFSVDDNDKITVSLQGISSGYTGSIESIYYQDFYEH